MLRKNLKNSSLIFLSSIFMALSNWGMLSLITKEVSLLVLGVFTLAIAVSNPIYQLLNFQLRPLYVTDRSEEKIEYSNYFTLRLVSVFFSFFIGFTLGILLSDTSMHFSIFMFVFILYGIDGVIDIISARFHYEEKYKIIATSNILRSLSNFLGIWVGIHFYNSLITGVILSCVIKFGFLLIFDFKFFKRFFPQIPILSFDLKKILKLFKQALPLGISLLLISLNVNISKYFVEYTFGKQIQGVFSTLSYLIILGNMIVATIGQLIMPKVSSLFRTKSKKKILLTHTMYILMAAIVGICLYSFSCFFSYSFLKMFFSDRIAKYSWLMPTVMIYASFVFLASATGYILTSIRVIKSQTFLVFCALSINVFLNFYFLNKVSLEQIILFSAVSFATQFLLGNFIFISEWRKM